MCVSAIGCDKESWKMSSEAMIMLAISVLTAMYLVYALLRPEKF